MATFELKINTLEILSTETYHINTIYNAFARRLTLSHEIQSPILCRNHPFELQ